MGGEPGSPPGWRYGWDELEQFTGVLAAEVAVQLAMHRPLGDEREVWQFCALLADQVLGRFRLVERRSEPAPGPG